MTKPDVPPAVGRFCDLDLRGRIGGFVSIDERGAVPGRHYEVRGVGRKAARLYSSAAHDRLQGVAARVAPGGEGYRLLRAGTYVIATVCLGTGQVGDVGQCGEVHRVDERGLRRGARAVSPVGPSAPSLRRLQPSIA